MKNRVIGGVILSIIIICINACENKVAVLPVPVPLAANCDTTHATYNSSSDSVSGIINTQCAVSGCHVYGSAVANDLTSYSAIQASGYITSKKGPTGTLMYTCLYNGTPYVMPNVAQPGWNDPCNQAKLKQWILNGFPQ
ncbi:MAG TPA: hypothetical protein VK783_00525 [Bacteroidia bacterium]|jgi:hypothetical protein|nr:hypothetical protein [Bacteroidia bacterium]